jgi:hypothetical protein
MDIPTDVKLFVVFIDVPWSTDSAIRILPGRIGLTLVIRSSLAGFVAYFQEHCGDEMCPTPSHSFAIKCRVYRGSW